jgi:hypothetical protein
MDRARFIPADILCAYQDIKRILDAKRVLVIDGELTQAVDATIDAMSYSMPLNTESLVVAPSEVMIHALSQSGRPVVHVGRMPKEAAARIVFVVRADQISHDDFVDAMRAVEKHAETVVLCGVVGGAADAVGNVFTHLAHWKGVPTRTVALADMTQRVEVVHGALDRSMWTRVLRELESPGTVVLCGSDRCRAADVRRMVSGLSGGSILRVGSGCMTREGAQCTVNVVQGATPSGGRVAVESMDTSDVLLRVVLEVGTESARPQTWDDTGLRLHAIADVHLHRLVPCKRVVYLTDKDRICHADLVTMDALATESILLASTACRSASEFAVVPDRALSNPFTEI